MSLLSIAEPGKSAAPHERKFAVGIDLGTTNSLVATRRNGTLELIKDEQGRNLCPSLVYYSSTDNVYVGYDALEKAKEDSNKPISSIKRLIGKKINEVSEIIDASTYDFSSSQNDLPLVITENGSKNSVEISAQILQHLKNQAKNYLDNDITDAVITVPAYFDDTQRQATKDAAELAGLNVLRLLNEPTAAAIAYGINENQEGTIVVYDLGGGTFDVSVLRIEKQVFKVLATGGNTSLGGDDFDHLLFNYLVEQLELKSVLSSLSAHVKVKYDKSETSADYNEQSNTIDVTQPQLRLLNQLKAEIQNLAVSVKKQLTDTHIVHLQDCAEFANIMQLAQECKSQVKADVSITREVFAKLIQPLIQKTLMSCHQVLIDAKVAKNDITQVILVGGSTRVPAVQEAVANFFKCKPLCSIDPDTVVALGAAMQADILIGNHSDDFLLIDVLPLSLGIEVYGGLVERIIPRNTTIPIARAQEFSTAVDGQTGIKIHVVQGERDRAVDCRSLATFSLKGLPPRAAGALKVRVTYTVDADGLLSVQAKELTTGKATEVQVQLSYGLTEDEVIKMLSDSTLYAQLDVALRKLYEELAESELLLNSVNKQVEKYNHLLSEEDQTHITQNVSKLKSLCEKYSADNINPELLNNDNAKTVREYANELNFWRSQLEISTRDFAARIMSSDISTYLSGKDIKDFIN